MTKQLTPSDIQSIAQAGEGYNAEFKIRVPNKLKEISEEICAFANASGGILLIGVGDDNKIHGAEIDNGKRSAIQNSINEISPHVSVALYAVEVEEKTVWVIEVNTGSQKPYVLSGAIYVRQGSNTQKLTTVEQMRDFFQQSDRIYFDEAPCIDFDLSSAIDQKWFEEFRAMSELSAAVSQEQIIRNLKLVLPDGNMKNGGVLFFGSAPEAFIETAVVRCIAFEGSNKTQIIDDKLFGGALMKQYGQAMNWLKGKLDVRYEIEGGGLRKEIWEIPETVLKEVLINALSHRDYYDKGAKIAVELFKDRVEISNPGGLTSAISLVDFGTKSHSRNPLIFGLFVRIHMVEQVGSGIGRIRDLMKAAKLPDPVFKTEGMFSVVLHRTAEETVEKTVEKTVELILTEMTNNPKVTIRELSEITGLTRRGVEYKIKMLKKDGSIKRIGADRGGRWKVIPNLNKNNK